MRIADRVVLYRPQAETLAGIVGRLLQPSVVEHQGFGLAVFQKQLAVVGTGKTPRDLLADGIPVKLGAIEKRGRGRHAYSNFSVVQLRARQPFGPRANPNPGVEQLNKNLRSGRLTSR